MTPDTHEKLGYVVSRIICRVLTKLNIKHGEWVEIYKYKRGNLYMHYIIGDVWDKKWQISKTCSKTGNLLDNPWM